MEHNPDKVRTIVSEILGALGRIEELGRLGDAEFLGDPHKVASAKYHLIVAIEGAVDLCNHVIARNGLRAPEDYADTFRVLGERNLFAPEFVDALIQMVRFRNRLVHIYWNIDDVEILRIVRTRLGDIRRFLEEFGAFLRT
ncbi:MAG: DUF86 domain-containing protein [Deltaproteobacteria bacterium]|nr:DUF86 domain-containing protein [Deltaproteobacteria bacterium]